LKLAATVREPALDDNCGATFVRFEMGDSGRPTTREKAKEAFFF